METVEIIFNFLKLNPEICYVVTVCVVTYIVLQMLSVKCTCKKRRMAVTFIVGLILLILYMLFVPNCTIQVMLLGLFASTGFYKYIMQPFLKLIGAEYKTDCKDKAASK